MILQASCFNMFPRQHLQPDRLRPALTLFLLNSNFLNSPLCFNRTIRLHADASFTAHHMHIVTLGREMSENFELHYDYLQFEKLNDITVIILS